MILDCIRSKVKPKINQEKINKKYIIDNPIGSGVSLENTKEGFFIKKANILSDKSIIKQSNDRHICKENVSLYEVDDTIFNIQNFSLDVGFGLSKFSYTLGISKEITNEKINRSLLLENDYKYILLQTEINSEPSKIWELSTDEFKNDVTNLEKDLKLKLTEDFISKYGTHIIVKCDYGYRFRKIFQTKKDTLKSINDFKLDSKLKIMEYINMNTEYTKQKITNYDVDSKESNVLILGDKSNVLAKMRGSELSFDWEIDTVIDSEVIDVYPEEYIPIYRIIPKELSVSMENVKKLTKEKEYELTIGWVKNRNYCCIHLEIDPKFFLGDFIMDIKLSTEQQRVISKSVKFQEYHIEFLNQNYKPTSITIECNKWERIDTKNIKSTIYYKSDEVYKSIINNFNIFNKVDLDNNKRLYTLNWDSISLDELVKEHPNETFIFT